MNKKKGGRTVFSSVDVQLVRGRTVNIEGMSFCFDLVHPTEENDPSSHDLLSFTPTV